jgi:hypothetical protein
MDVERAVLDRDLDVLGLEARQRRLDGQGIRSARHIERDAVAFECAGDPAARTHEAVFKEPVHRLPERDELAQGRGAAYDRHVAHLLVMMVVGLACGPRIERSAS